MHTRSRSVVLLVFLALLVARRQAFGATPLTTVRVASGLSQPLFVTHAPGDQKRVFIAEKAGRIKILNLQTGLVLATPFLDVTSLVNSVGDHGFYAIAFHPDYATNGYFYVSYTDLVGSSTLARYQVSGSPATSNVANPASATVLLTVTEPQASHNIGWIAFGPEGYLYVALGDGGFNTCDPDQRAQNLDELHGKILRLDVDGGTPYGIPPDNPFVGVAGADEIWAYGLRNPWRNAFDPTTGDLFIADAGQASREEVDFQPGSSGGGENYGWDCMEGTECSTISGCGTAGCTCGAPSLVLPIYQYDHTFGCTIIGGEVYRGAAIPDLAGAYFFADFCSNRIWSLRYDGSTLSDFQERTTELAPGGGLSIASPVSFGKDAAGEMYICDMNGGEVFKIIKRCGNGVVDAGEQCDAGSANGGSASCCGATCQYKPNGNASCDGNDCTRPDTCTNGVCTPGSCAGGAVCSICGGTCVHNGGSCTCQF
jgi:glucose/arabinose dehydrogenase